MRGCDYLTCEIPDRSGHAFRCHSAILGEPVATMGLLGGDADLMDLGDSMFARLEGLVRHLDQMSLVWQFPTDNDTLDQLADYFDSIILGYSAIQDNLALLIGRHLGFRGLQRFEWGLRSRKRRKRLEETDTHAARQIEACLTERDAILALAVDLRDQAVHQARIGLLTLKRQRSPEEGRLRIREPGLPRVLKAVEAIGGSGSSWGITDQQPPRRVSSIVLTKAGKVEVKLDQVGEAMLDPIPFATRLVAAIADLVDGLFQAADFATAPGVTEEQRKEWREPSKHWLHQEESSETLRLLSPFAGM
jgi:hypothetical protein